MTIWRCSPEPAKRAPKRLIEQLTAAQSLSERRIFFDALVTLKSGTSTLIAHARRRAAGTLARNAADLLGELNCLEAEGALADLLRHDDDRVRRAATNALSKLGTMQSRVALKKALKDTSPQVRATAAAGLVGKNGKETAATLLRALDERARPSKSRSRSWAPSAAWLTPQSVDRLIKAADSRRPPVQAQGGRLSDRRRDGPRRRPHARGINCSARAHERSRQGRARRRRPRARSGAARAGDPQLVRSGPKSPFWR